MDSGSDGPMVASGGVAHLVLGLAERRVFGGALPEASGGSVRRVRWISVL